MLIGDWPSGLYFARLTRDPAAGGYAPFVVRPTRLGEHRVAVVLPTNTWQAYNFRDDDGDGVGRHLVRATRSVTSVDLARPFLDRGVPPHFSGYDLRSCTGSPRTARTSDLLSDDDLERAGGRRAGAAPTT